MEKRNNKLFNTPLELGLRALYILSQSEHHACDLQRLVYYDYLLVHSSDVLKGPESIHPPVPLRSGEILVKRKVLQEGLQLMHTKELLEVKFDDTGISFKASKLTLPFLSYYHSDYSAILKKRAKWVNKKFSSFSNSELEKFINSNLGKWGSEFSFDTETDLYE